MTSPSKEQETLCGSTGTWTCIYGKMDHQGSLLLSALHGPPLSSQDWSIIIYRLCSLLSLCCPEGFLSPAVLKRNDCITSTLSTWTALTRGKVIICLVGSLMLYWLSKSSIRCFCSSQTQRRPQVWTQVKRSSLLLYYSSKMKIKQGEVSCHSDLNCVQCRPNISIISAAVAKWGRARLWHVNVLWTHLKCLTIWCSYVRKDNFNGIWALFSLQV